MFAGALMLLFILAISQAWIRGLSIDCGCWRRWTGSTWKDPIPGRNIREIYGLALTALYLIRYPLGRFSIEKSK
jgi:hypothetical protein